ncbi:MAG TPA: DUF4157 domain-containing protein [Longimicrobium sp.]|nr:DUF4157 domain-containing protein [Longimicrobium sp.]
MSSVLAERAPATRPAAAAAKPTRRPSPDEHQAAPPEVARTAAPGHAFGKVRLHAGAVPAVQAKLTISQPGDSFEQEAERVADEVVRASSSPPAVEEGTDDESVQTAHDPASVAMEQDDAEAVQMARDPLAPGAESPPGVDDDEREAGPIVGMASQQGGREGEDEEEDGEHDAPPPSVDLDTSPGDERVQRATRPDGKEDEEKDEEEERDESIHRRAAASGGDDPPPITGGLGAGTLARELSSARASGGRPLSGDARSSMERAFGADFASVRIHDDSTADRLSRSVHALAFTNRQHIFFSSGRFDPGSGAGRRLLAHELTHVVQQVPSVRGGASSAAAPPAVARQAAGPAAAQVQRAPIPGADGALLAAGGEEVVQRAPGDPPPNLKLVARIYFLDKGGNIVFETGLVMSSHPGVVGTYEGKLVGAPGARHLLFGEQDIIVFRAPPGMEAALTRTSSISVTVFPASATGGKAEKDKAPGKTGQKVKGEEGGKGTPGKPGSKYGWLGLLDLDQETIDALEKIFELLEDEEEYLALRDTLEMLSDLGKHAATVESWFADPSRLLAVALGLEENAAVNALAGWVERAPTKRKLKTAKPERKGIIGVALKVAAIIEKLRRVLRPVFAVRAKFIELFGAVGLLLESISAIQNVLDEEKRKKFDPAKLLAGFSEDLSVALHQKMEDLKKGFAVKVETLDKSEFVTSEEIGRVVLAAGLKAVPGAGKLVVKVGTKIPGLEGLIADKLVAPLIPKSVMDGLNEKLGSLAKLLAPAAKKAAAGLDEVFTGLEDELAAFLARQTKDLAAFLHAGPGGGHADARAEARFRSMTAASGGEALPEGVRREMEGHLGFDFGRVRIHRDAAAGRASQAVNANAFTLGSDLFFAPGRYDPGSSQGRRLLAHELTHVVQQDGAGGQVVQRDFAAVRALLIRKLGESVKAALKTAVGGGPAKQAKAKQYRDEAAKLRNKRVVSATNPGLPAAYVYVRSGGKISGIRRKLSWIRFVPALTIDKGIIKFGVEFDYDPKDADRAALRRACKCGDGRQAHHVLPLETRGDPIVKLAESKGFSFNGLDNGVCLTETVHYGSHPNYTKRVQAMLAALAVKHPGGVWTPKLKTDFYAKVQEFKNFCKARRSKLD